MKYRFKEVRNLRISLGLIMKDLITTEPIFDFLDNAESHGHELYNVIIVYSNKIDNGVVDKIRRRINLELVKINEDFEMYDQLRLQGISQKSIDDFLKSDILGDTGKVAYGRNRNNVIIKAILSGTDVLFFVDTDVYPKLLVGQKDGTSQYKDVDFFGRHMDYLKFDDVAVTTSDYSGYYIIPPMFFEGMDKLFLGLQKQDAYDFVRKSLNGNNGMNYDNYYNRETRETNKILGGNVAIKLSCLKELIPFFSTYYYLNGEYYLTRGEDTLLGIAVSNSKTYKCIDIDTKIFHNTYGDYPNIPDIKRNINIRDRFFYASMGWIGRNPFLNWIQGFNVSLIYEEQMNAIKIGSKSIARYLNDDRFLILPTALELSYSKLNNTIFEYNKLLNAWNEISKKINSRGDLIEDIVS